MVGNAHSTISGHIDIDFTNLVIPAKTGIQGNKYGKLDPPPMAGRGDNKRTQSRRYVIPAQAGIQNSYQPVIEIVPFRVVFLNQSQLPTPLPPLNLFLALQGGMDIFYLFKVH